VPWHYNAIRDSIPPINDITTDTENPPVFVAVALLRAAEGANPITYQGSKFADQQKRAYPTLLRLSSRYRPIQRLIARSPPHDSLVGRLLPPTRRQGVSRRARGAAGTASPTTSSSASRHRMRVAASTCARRHGRGAAISVSMPLGYVPTSRHCGQPRPSANVPHRRRASLDTARQPNRLGPGRL
jgi:hypothetical protein